MIYADYNGSAPLCNSVKDYLIKRLEKGPFANPNAIHYLGTKTMMGMENARSVCAKILGADFDQVIFNSGATEERESNIVKSIPSNSRLGFKDVLINLTVFSSCANPSIAKYSVCIGTMYE